MTAQYTIPVAIGDVSPAITAVMASSSSAMPRRVSPSAMRDCPRPSRPNVASSRSPNRSAIDGDLLEGRVCADRVARAEHAQPLGDKQPSTLRAVVAGLLDEAAGTREPAAGLSSSPRCSSIRPSEIATPIASSILPSRTAARWVRAASAADSSGRPVRCAEMPKRSRSSAPSALAASAALRASNAAAHAFRSYARRPDSSAGSVDFWIGMRTAAVDPGVGRAGSPMVWRQSPQEPAPDPRRAARGLASLPAAGQRRTAGAADVPHGHRGRHRLRGSRRGRRLLGGRPRLRAAAPQRAIPRPRATRTGHREAADPVPAGPRAEDREEPRAPRLPLRVDARGDRAAQRRSAPR